jgi:hypothetical protein
MRERQVGDSALECHERAAGNGIVEMATAALALLPIPTSYDNLTDEP